MFYNRDIIVLGDHTKLMNKEELELHIQQIETLLYTIERTDAYYAVSEIIDINRYKVISARAQIKQILREKEKPFVFLFNKN